MADTTHDRISRKIAQKRGGVYNSQSGPDVVNSREAIEVEIDPNGFTAGIRQLGGFNKSRYLAVPENLVEKAIGRTKGLKVGVMDEAGKIRKRAGKKG